MRNIFSWEIFSLHAIKTKHTRTHLKQKLFFQKIEEKKPKYFFRFSYALLLLLLFLVIELLLLLRREENAINMCVRPLLRSRLNWWNRNRNRSQKQKPKQKQQHKQQKQKQRNRNSEWVSKLSNDDDVAVGVAAGACWRTLKTHTTATTTRQRTGMEQREGTSPRQCGRKREREGEQAQAQQKRKSSELVRMHVCVCELGKWNRNKLQQQQQQGICWELQQAN